MFEPTKRRADTMNLVGEQLVAWSPTLPSPQCWMLVGAATPSWWSAAITHLDEYQAAGMLEPTTTQIRDGGGTEDFVSSPSPREDESSGRSGGRPPAASPRTPSVVISASRTTASATARP